MEPGNPDQPFDSVLIDTSTKLRALLDTIGDTKECAVDTETTGLDWAIGHKPFMATFCAEDSTAWAAYKPEYCDEVMQFILQQQAELIMHNAKFDLHMIRVWNGWEPRSYFDLKIYDTMMGFRIYHNDRSAALKNAAPMYIPTEQCEAAAPQRAVLEWIKNNTKKVRIAGKWIYEKPPFSEVPQDLMFPYAVQDAWMTRRCKHGLYATGLERPKQIELYETEVELVKLLVHVEAHGWPIDGETLMKNTLEANERVQEALQKFEVLAPGVLVSSPKQVATLFYDELEESVIHTTKTGRPATNTAALINMANREVADVVYSARKWKTALNKYNELGRFRAADGACHSNFKQERARTGRFGSATPNLQNLPRPAIDDSGIVIPGKEFSLARFVFKPEAGSEWLFADYSQIEMNIFAHYSQDEALLSAIWAGVDLHALTASRIYGLSVDEFLRTMKGNRKFGKLLNFTIIYGGGVNKITKALLFGSAQNDPVTLEEARTALLVFRPHATDRMLHAPHQFLAKELRDAYKREFVQANQFMIDVQDTIKWRWKNEGQGYVRNIFGRITPVDFERAYAGTNYIVQGTAADLMKAAMIRVWARLEIFCKEKSLTPWKDIAMIATVHDELIFKVPVGMSHEIASIINEPLTNWPKFTVPIKAEYAMTAEGLSWAQKKDFRLAA